MSLLNNSLSLIQTFYPSEIQNFKKPLKLEVNPLSPEIINKLKGIISQHKKKENPEIFSNGSDKRWYKLSSENSEFYKEVLTLT